MRAASEPQWTRWGLSPGPSACEADVIPLHHAPLLPTLISWPHVQGQAPDGDKRPRLPQALVARLARAFALGHAAPAAAAPAASAVAAAAAAAAAKAAAAAAATRSIP